MVSDTAGVLKMKFAYSSMAMVIRWCVSCVLAVIVAIPAFTSMISAV
jgi:hypothetical protein